MYRALGAAPPTIPDEEFARWERDAEDEMRRRLGDDLVVAVCDDPDRPGRLAACGAGNVVVRLPVAWHRGHHVGYVQWMSTEPAHRRKGLGRAILRFLMAWYEQQGIGVIELHASSQGAALYRSEGFWGGSTGTAMRYRAWDLPRGGDGGAER